ncbi:AI-2E family transporter [Bacteroidota bacterium]
MKWANSKIEVFIFLILVFYLLHILSSLLIPLAFAFLLAALFQPVIIYLKERKIPGWIIYPTTILISLGVIFVLIGIISHSISEFAQQQDYFSQRLELKLDPLLIWIKEISQDYFDLKINADLIVRKILESEILSSGVSSFINMVGNFASSFLIFAFYYIVFLTTMSEYKKFLKFVSGKKKNAKLIKSYESIQTSIYTYVRVKILVSFLTAFLVYIILVIFGVKFAFLWGLLTFLLNFIPIVGSLIAVILPTLMALIQFDAISSVLILFLLLEGSQIAVGNIVEPMIMGSSLQLNTITTMFGLVFWGYIWGTSGMLLSMPLVVIFKIIIEQNEDFAAVGRMLGTPSAEAEE